MIEIFPVLSITTVSLPLVNVGHMAIGAATQFGETNLLRSLEAVHFANEYAARITVAEMVLIVLGIASSYTDFSRLRIPNAITYSALSCGICLNLVAATAATCSGGANLAWIGGVGVPSSVAGALVGFCAMAAVYALSGRGAGDVKLAAAYGSLVGPTAIFATLLYTHVVAGVAVLIWMTCKIGPWRLATAAVRGAGYVMAPQLVLPPQLDVACVAKTPVPMAGFFVVGLLLAFGG